MIFPENCRYAFLDIETTGLSPAKNYILEVAWVFTDAYFRQISEPKSFIVDNTIWHNDLVFKQIDESPFLTNMHTSSGLYDDLSDPEVEKTAMTSILGEFIEDAKAHGAPGIPFRFAGYSVSFDRDFLRQNGWYQLIESDTLGFQMHHRILDISSIIQLYEAANAPVPYIVNENAHRALDDALHAMKTAQAFALDLGSADL